MKTFLFTISTIMTIVGWNTCPLYSQSKQLWLGLESGISSANMGKHVFSPVFSDAQPKLGFVGGLILQVELTQKFSLKTQLGYEQKGTRFMNQLNDRIIVNFDYVLVSLLPRYTFGKREYMILGLGPYVGYWVRRTARFTDQRPYDWGISGEMGIGLPVKEKWRIEMALRPSFGVYNLINLNRTGRDTPVRNSSIGLLVSLQRRL